MAIDWRAVWMMLPKRRFSAAELQRAIPEPPSRSVQVAVLLNIALGVVAYVWAFGGDIPLLLSAALAAASLLLVAMLALAWRDPSHRLAHAAYYVLPVALGLGTGLAMRRIGALNQAQVLTVALVALIASLMLWFAIVYRHKYVEMRLAELDERERSADMARQLARPRSSRTSCTTRWRRCSTGCRPRTTAPRRCSRADRLPARHAAAVRPRAPGPGRRGRGGAPVPGRDAAAPGRAAARRRSHRPRRRPARLPPGLLLTWWKTPSSTA
jgi:hypothetical protein